MVYSLFGLDSLINFINNGKHMDKLSSSKLLVTLGAELKTGGLYRIALKSDWIKVQ